MGRIVRAVQEPRLALYVPDERLPDDEGAPQHAGRVPQRHRRARLEREALDGNGERQGDREEHAAREPLALEDAPVVAVAHEAAQRARAPRGEELEIEQLLSVEDQAGKRPRALPQRLGLGAVDHGLEEGTAVRLDQR